MLKVVIMILTSLKLIHAGFAPVVTWGDGCPEIPALKSDQMDVFVKCIVGLIKNNMLVVFVENDLSVEDFKCVDKSGQSCYQFLTSVTPKKFYSQVEEPFETIKSLRASFNDPDFNDHKRRNDSIHCKIGTLRVIRFLDDSPTRAALLQSHDSIIKGWQQRIQSPCNTVFMYMGQPYTSKATERGKRGNINSKDLGKIRHKKDKKPKPTPPQATIKKGRFGIKWRLLTQNIDKKAPKLLKDMKVTDISKKDLNVTVHAAGENLIFVFDTANEDYRLKKVLVNDVAHTLTRSVQVGFGDSFVCKKLELNSAKGSLVFEDVQLEVTEPNSTFAKFGSPVDCNSLFSPGAFMVTFLCAILFAILSMGLIFILEIKPNDKMDNPDGPRLLFRQPDS